MPTSVKKSFPAQERRPGTALTPYHARYYSMLLSRGGMDGAGGGSEVERYLPALFSAGIDLHPHQIDAAVFASRSPFREGVILADEEGLGKTIEAGLALLQASLEGRRRLLVLCPSALVEHWHEELVDKFSLTSIGLGEVDSGQLLVDSEPRGEMETVNHPLSTINCSVVVAAYGDAYRQAERLAAIPWDLVVLDEAHQLANAGLSDHVQANAIRAALQGRRKILLTATPVQNSVMDLFHLVRFVDETTFIADPEAFRARYAGQVKHRAELASRAQSICQRTLRKRALTMPVTRRSARTFLVAPSVAEMELSKRVSLYFHRDPLLAFPKVKEHEIRLTFWKRMASSWRALAESLERVSARLDHVPGAYDEQVELRALADQARALEPGTRATAFLDALTDARCQLRKAGAPDRAVVFSESRTTLSFLEELLSGNGYAGRIVMHHPGAAGKKALAAFASGEADILLATDAAGVGVDLSHCALVVNYDLPWNVQKLEQRISRCHRYGQKHDVLVLNFLDPANRADRRLYDSLNRKLKRFDDLFGQSETILGRVSGDKEMADGESPRTIEAIQSDQEATRAAKREEIEKEERQAEVDLLAHFDDEVRARFKRYGQTIPKELSRMEGWLWMLTKQRLGQRADFNEESRSFVLDKSPYPGLRLSRIIFGMDKSRPLAERYRLNHPLAKRVLADCLEGDLTHGQLTLKARGEFTSGMTGEIGLWLAGAMNEVATVTRPVLCGVLNVGDGEGDGRVLREDECAELMKLPVLSCVGGAVAGESDEIKVHRGRVWKDGGVAARHGPLAGGALAKARDHALEAARRRFLAEQDAALSEHLERLQCWAKDEEAALAARLEEEGRRIEGLRERAAAADSFAGQFGLHREALKRGKARRADEARLAGLVAEVRRRRDELIDAARAKTTARFWDDELFVLRFTINEGRDP